MSKSQRNTDSDKTHGSATQRRDAFVQQSSPPRKSGLPPWLLVVPLLLVVAMGAAVLTARQAPQPAAAQAAAVGDGWGFPAGINSQSPNKRYPAISPNADGELTVPVSALADGKARFFTTGLPDGKAINLFVVRSSDGVVRAAIDSCDVCYAARKGYHQEGDYMVCNNCGQRFATAKVNELRGGCNPVPLTRTVRGEDVVIRLADLARENRAENGQPLF